MIRSTEAGQHCLPACFDAFEYVLFLFLFPEETILYGPPDEIVFHEETRPCCLDYGCFPACCCCCCCCYYSSSSSSLVPYFVAAFPGWMLCFGVCDVGLSGPWGAGRRPLCGGSGPVLSAWILWGRHLDCHSHRFVEVRHSFRSWLD